MTTTPDTAPGTAPGTAPAARAGSPATAVSLPLRAVLPSFPVMGLAVMLATAATAITVIRPKQLPYSVQATVDYAVVITVAAHPFETLLVRLLARRRNLTPSSRRKAQGATFTFGALSLGRAIRAVRQAPRL